MAKKARDDANNGGSGSSMNPDLEELHDALVEKVVTLSDLIGDAPDSDTVMAIIRERDEVNHRVNLVGNLLFTQQTAAITRAVDRVREVNDEVNQDIQDI